MHKDLPFLAALLGGTCPDPLEAALVIGSGLGGLVSRIQVECSRPYEECPPLQPTCVDGHEGRLIVGRWGGRRVLVFAGRNHGYEGHRADCLTAPARLAAAGGVGVFVLTNAAGGIREDLAPGRLMIVRQHIDCTQVGFWRREAGADESPLYNLKLIALLTEAARELSLPIAHGTYAAMLGPNYETPAEIRALQILGADAVGMSTAREVAAATALGLECAAISCITNRAAGLSSTRLSHQEVLENSRRQADRLGDLLEEFLRRLP